MTSSTAIPTPTTPARTSVLWLLGTALLALVPVAQHLPVWVSVAYTLAVLWRLAHDRWNVPQPGRWLRGLLALAAITIVYRHYGTLLGREPGVSLLVLLIGFKLFELGTLRDAVLAALLLFLMLLGSFLFDNSLLLGLYTVVCVIAVVAVLLQIQYPAHKPVTTLRLAGVFVAQALPIMLVAYLLFPRLPDALWGFQSTETQGITGIPDDMRPGNVSELNMSDAPAFRAYFEGEPPAARNLYWRVRVLWDSDGRTWRVGPMRAVRDRLRNGTNVVRYRLVLEPNDKVWLPALDLPVTTPTDVRARSGFIYEATEPRRERKTVEFASATRYQTAALSDDERVRALAVPAVSDRVRRLAEQWRTSGDGDVVRAVLEHFRRESFVYTLTPPPLGDDPVDEFLFETRRGFCEHYAAAFVTLMRAAGLPARVVLGYQGGTYNPSGNYFIVRQADAHAWAEVWTMQSGWTRVDPTAAIAPSRVEYGIDAVRRLSLQGLPLAGLGSDALRRAIQLPWLESAWFRTRLLWDYANLSWYLWVTDYNLERQAKLLGRLGLTNSTVALIVMVVLQLVLLYLVFRWRAHQPRDVVQRIYDDYCHKLARVGITRANAEGPFALRERIHRQRPDLTGAVDRITEMYVTLRYGKATTVPPLADFATAVRAFRPRRRV